MDPLALLRRLSRRLRFVRLHRPEIREAWVELGSDYGGWPLVPRRLPPSPLVYSFGVGSDISFDRAVIDRFGAIVHAFDPTPRSMQWIAQQATPTSFTFHPVGIAGADETALFFPPSNDAWDSFSNAPASDQPGEPVAAQVFRLDTLMHRLGHDRIDVLKMDIEGFEYGVIASLREMDARPGQILVEFHHRMYQSSDQDTRDAVETLRALGYRLFFVSDNGREYGFVQAAASGAGDRPG